jgi:hypothetical protein
MAKAMYMTEELPFSRHWCIRGNINNVKRLVIFEKITLARKFWRKLSCEEREIYILMVTGGNVMPVFHLVRKFICLAKKAFSESDLLLQYSTGDMDPSSFDVQYNLENSNHLGPADLHLMMKIEMLGPFPDDGEFI